MTNRDLMAYCFNEHVKDVGGNVYFSFDEYKAFWTNHEVGIEYAMINKDGSVVNCLVAYYPLPYYKDLRALIEIHKEGAIDFREVPVKFLKQKAGLSTGEST